MNEREFQVTLQAAPTGEISFFELVLPEQTNHYGTLYGANALEMLGKAAFICASRYVRRAVVMARSEAVDFVAPIKLGSLLEMKAFIITTGRSSLTVEVNAVSETLSDGVRITAIRGRFIMVAVDANGQPRPLSQDNSEIVIKKEKEINETA